jgi:pimeloyl-ACP methyl ester carboxylesterase
MQRSLRVFAAALIGFLLGTILLTSNALHAPPRFTASSTAADALAHNTGSTWEDVRVVAGDGVALDGWQFRPGQPNGSVVILLHGIADNRLGMLAHASFLLRNGFSVLLLDLRGHGESGGDLITYGLKEADDVRCWADVLLKHQGFDRLYGIGQSLGAAVLVQSLKTEHRFRAIVADSPFATFEEIAYDRMHQISGIPNPLFWPLIRVAFSYADLRYGLDLGRASPMAVIRGTKVPILLIHGAVDTNIPVRHSQELHAANPQTSQLWIVEHAGHVASLSTASDNYIGKVLWWFRSHP